MELQYYGDDQKYTSMADGVPYVIGILASKKLKWLADKWDWAILLTTEQVLSKGRVLVQFICIHVWYNLILTVTTFVVYPLVPV